MGVLHVKAATHNADPTTVGTKDDDSDPYGLQGAFDNVAAGDEIRIWDDATYTIATQVDIDTTAGTAASPILVRGANSSGTVDGTRPILQGNGTPGDLFSNGGSDIIYYRFDYLDFDCNSAAVHCVTQDGASTSHHWTFFDCIFRNATGNGVDIRAQGLRFIKCEAYSNGAAGFGHYSTGGPVGTLYQACLSHDNTGHGFEFQAKQMAANDCIAYDNGGDGFNVNSYGLLHLTITGCISERNDSDGFSIDAAAEQVTICNNSACNNGAYGFNFNGGEPSGFVDYNHTNNNTSGATDLVGGMPGYTNYTGAPGFASVVDGSEDYTPADGSDLDGNGVAAMSNIERDIGAAKAADPAGGGGGGALRGWGVPGFCGH